MLIEHDGARPRVDASAYIAPTAVLCGDVEVGPDCRILFGAVLTAEDGPVRLGEGCLVMENAVVRGRAGHPALLGNRVLVGPHAHVNGAEIGDEAFVATGASLFPGSRLGAGAEIRINAVLHVNSSLPAGAELPIGWIAVGDPAHDVPARRARRDLGDPAHARLRRHRRGRRHGSARRQERDERADGDVRRALRSSSRRPRAATDQSSTDSPGSSATTFTAGASSRAAARNGSSGARR